MRIRCPPNIQTSLKQQQQFQNEVKTLIQIITGIKNRHPGGPVHFLNIDPVTFTFESFESRKLQQKFIFLNLFNPKKANTMCRDPITSPKLTHLHCLAKRVFFTRPPPITVGILSPLNLLYHVIVS